MSQGDRGYKDVAPETRLRMQAVRRSDTAPELVVRKILHGLGYRYRLHQKALPGTPDIVLPRHKKIVFVHGCFWHGHEQCKRAKVPSKNAASWRVKIEGNKTRDTKNIAALNSLGWKVLIVWECEVMSDPSHVKKRLSEFLAST